MKLPIIKTRIIEKRKEIVAFISEEANTGHRSLDDERCLVANPRFQTHVHSKSLVDLGDVGLLATIDAAECSAAERQFAKGNFFRHRDLSRAARCFEAAIAEDPQLGMALVDLIELRRTQQDQGSVTTSIDKLRSYAEFEEIVLAEDFVMNATQEVVMRCETVRRDSAYLSRAMAEHLYQLGRERPDFLVSAGRMAKAACEMIPSSAENTKPSCWTWLVRAKLRWRKLMPP